MKALPWADEFLALSREGRTEAVQYVENRLGDLRTSTGIDAPFGSHLTTADV